MTEELCRLREEELAFFAKMGADVSHEIRNVLSIINENAGLLDDQLALVRGRKVPDPEKLKKVATRIARQVRRGIGIMECFSRFAHAADQPQASVDLTSLVQDATVLAQRHARQHGGSLEATLPDQPVSLMTSPFSLQYVLFCCLQMVWQAAETSEPVRVTLSQQQGAAVLKVSGAASPDSQGLARPNSELNAVLNELQGSLDTSSAEGVLELALSLPLQMPEE
jgi:C4-dicarboxylate-specific signal transduction histidine kinase